MKKILFIVSAALLNLYAQDSIYTLPVVEVQGIREDITAFQSSIFIDEKFIQKSEAGLSLAESLAQIAGINVGDRNNPSLGDKIIIRGIGARASFGIRGIKIIADNIPLTLPDGQSQTNNIDLFSSNYITVLKGPAGFLYGNASGGVINYESRISDEEFKITPQILFGSYNLSKYSLKAEGSIDSFKYLVSFNKVQSDGFRQHSGENYYLINSIFKKSLSDDLNLSLVLNYFNAPYLLNPGSLDKNANPESSREFVRQQGAGEKADQIQSGISLDYKIDEFRIETTFYLLGRSVINPIPGRIINLERTASGIRTIAGLMLNLDEIKLNLAGGLDFEYQDDDRSEFENIGLNSLNYKPAEIFDNLNYGSLQLKQDEQVAGTGSFLTAEAFLNNNFSFLGGLRYDNYSFKVDNKISGGSGKQVFNNLSPAVGVSFKTSNGLRIFANYTTSFQTPTTSELSNNPHAAGGFNQDLKPEKLNGFEAGVAFRVPLLNSLINAEVYLINFDDLLIPYQIENSEEVFFKNAGSARNTGADINLSVDPVSDVNFLISYSFMHFVYTGNQQFTGNFVPGIPKHNLFVSLSYLPEAGFFAGLRIKWKDKLFTNDFNGPPPGENLPADNFINNSYLETNLRTGYIFDFKNFKLELFSGVNNLFNKKYYGSIIPNAAGGRFFEPAPGRNFFGGIRMIF